MKKNKNNELETENAVSQSAEPLKKRKKKRKKAPIIILAVIVVLVIVVRFVACGNGTETAIVTTTKAMRGDLEETVSTSGTVNSDEQKIYFSRASATIEEVHVVAGDSVKNGDLLVTYDMEAMDKALREAALHQTVSLSSYNSTISANSDNQSKLQEANTNLSVLNQQIADYKAYLTQLKEQLTKNQRDTSSGLATENMNLTSRSSQIQNQINALDKDDPNNFTQIQELTQQLQEVSAAQARNSYLQQIASSSASDYDVKMQKEIDDIAERLSECEKYKAEMESQKTTSENSVMDSYQKENYAATLEIAQMTYSQAEENYYTAKQGVIAAFDGIVVDCTAVEGATIPSGTQLMVLADSNNIKVNFNASKYDLEKLEIGQSAKLTISGNVYDGKVSKIDRMASMNQSGTPMVGVEIHITNPDDNIILGLDAKIEINTKNTKNALLVPVEVINADKEGDFLFVVENGIIVRKAIVCGISSDTWQEVIEGITEEDQIVLTTFSTIEEGMAVIATPTY